MYNVQGTTLNYLKYKMDTKLIKLSSRFFFPSPVMSLQLTSHRDISICEIIYDLFTVFSLLDNPKLPSLKTIKYIVFVYRHMVYVLCIYYI